MEVGIVIHGLVAMGSAGEEEIVDYVKEIKGLELDDESYNIDNLLEEIDLIVEQLQTELGVEDLEIFYKVTLARCIMNLLLNLVSLTTNSLLIFGICQARYKMILPTLIWNPINVLIEIIVIIILSALFKLNYIFIIIGMLMYILLPP